MYKPIHERDSKLRFYELEEFDSQGGYMDGDEGRVSLGFEMSESRNGSFVTSDPNIVREVRDQLDAWLEQYEEDE